MSLPLPTAAEDAPAAARRSFTSTSPLPEPDRDVIRSEVVASPELSCTDGLLVTTPALCSMELQCMPDCDGILKRFALFFEVGANLLPEPERDGKPIDEVPASWPLALLTPDCDVEHR